MQFSAHLTATARSSRGRRNRAGIATRPLASIECVYWPVNIRLSPVLSSVADGNWLWAGQSWPVPHRKTPVGGRPLVLPTHHHNSPLGGILHPDWGPSNTKLGRREPRKGRGETLGRRGSRRRLTGRRELVQAPRNARWRAGVTGRAIAAIGRALVPRPGTNRSRVWG